MKLLFVLIGAVLGLVGGELPGAVAGAVLGFVAAIVWKAARSSRVASDDGVAPLPAVAPATLAQRVQALEQQVAELRAQVRVLGAGTSAPFESVESVERVAIAPTRAAGEFVAAAPLAEPAPLPEVVQTTPPAADWTAPAPSAPPPPPPAVPLRDRLPPFVARLVFGGNTIVKVGVVLLFIGLAFLLRYTAERVSVPAELRYAGVALAGAVLLGLGWHLRARPDRAGGSGYGVILQGAGIGVFYLTALAALRLHPLLSPTLAFAFMAAVALLGAVLAVLQDAPWLALVAVAEGFAAPVLVASGGSTYLPLFSYMAILDAGVVAMAAYKAWRPLNLVGAVATFALAGAWAQAHYVRADRAGVQAFLVLFFLLFTATGVLFARRALAGSDETDAPRPLADRAADALRRVGRVDSTLTFGVPLAAFTLQYLMVRDLAWGSAWAAAAFALFHIVLGGALMRGAGARYALLGEAHVIVGVIFATLAIPLALEGVWTGATWAIEAAGMYWLGFRQRRLYARAFALLVLAGAAARLLADLGIDTQPGTPLLTGSAFGMAMSAVAFVAMDLVRRRAPPEEQGTLDRLAGVALPFAASLAFAALAWMLLPAPWAAAATAWIGVLAMTLAAWLRHPALAGAAFVLQVGAAIGTLAFGPAPWAAADAPATLPWGPLVLALAGLVSGDRARAAARLAPAWWCGTAAQWVLVAWSFAWWSQGLPPALWQVLQAHGASAAWWNACAIWLTATSATLLAAAAWRDWRVAGQATLATLPAWVLIAFTGPVGVDAAAPSAAFGWLAWPLALAWHLALLRWQARWRPAALVAPLHVAGLWFFVALAACECARRVGALGAPGSAWAELGSMLVPALVLALLTRPALRRRWPLSECPDAYLMAGGAPLALALLAWLLRGNTTAGAAAPLPYVPLLNPLEIGQGLALLALLAWVRALPPAARAWLPRPALAGILGATAFALVTGLVLRTCHHLAGVAWDPDALFASTLAQAALSVTWSLIGVSLMLAGHRGARRVVWLTGAGLLGVVVAKLFLVELADRGSLPRIVSFLVVGALMLVVGYFAPLPPKRAPVDVAPEAS